MIYKYIRFSTDKQDEKQQERTIDLWLQQKGVVADSVIKDEGISGGTSYKQRNLFALVKGLKMDDTLIVSEISRITRSGFGELDEMIRDYFKPNHLRLVICNVGLDIDCSNINAITELQLSMLSIFAKMEKELIVGRTKSALDARKALKERDGGWMSKSGNWTTHLGRKAGTKGVSTSASLCAAWKESIGTNKDRKRQYKQIHEMRARGETMAGIADTMNSLDEPAPKGGLWSAAQVARVLSTWGKYFSDIEKHLV